MPDDPIQALRSDSQQVNGEASRLSRLEGRRVDHLGFAVKTARLADVVWSMGDELSGEGARGNTQGKQGDSNGTAWV